MKAWLDRVSWNLAVWLGLVEPPKPQPIPVRAQPARPQRRR
ncbi:PA1414 family protein [Stutzerimonas azotifigens]|nr:PA1414 family protein [Stutzerimonas azotifigens]